jgi:hypothetical protein
VESSSTGPQTIGDPLVEQLNSGGAQNFVVLTAEALDDELRQVIVTAVINVEGNGSGNPVPMLLSSNSAPAPEAAHHTGPRYRVIFKVATILEKATACAYHYANGKQR